MSIERKQVGARMSQIVIHGDTVYLAGLSGRPGRPGRRRRAGRRAPVLSGNLDATGWSAVMATQTLNSVTTAINPNYSFTVTATPTDLQTTAFELLGVKPIRVQ